MRFPVRPCLFFAITSLGLAWGCSLNGQGEIPGANGVSDPGPGVGNPNDGAGPGVPGAGGATFGAGGAAAMGGSAASSGGAGFAGGAAAGGAGGAKAGDAGPFVNTIPDAGQSAGDDAGPEPSCDAEACDAGAP